MQMTVPFVLFKINSNRKDKIRARRNSRSTGKVVRAKKTVQFKVQNGKNQGSNMENGRKVENKVDMENTKK